MNAWLGQEHDEQWLEELEELHAQARYVNSLLIALVVFVLIVIAGSVTGVGT